MPAFRISPGSWTSKAQKKFLCLPDDEFCDILNLAKKPEWAINMLEANQDPYDYDVQGLTEYLKRLETVTLICAALLGNEGRNVQSIQKGMQKKNGNGEA
jgi:hypothetical protein